ncbi:MAG TPA: restriction endonuclease, partial [Bacteroidales bacterium]|nr:restriction endonuclease [Bacteroidales bacterium]
MSKTGEVLDLLRKLGIPKQQQNERSALTLLAIAQIREDSNWTEAVQQPIIIHDIMNFIRENYNRDYAENSRETIRRQTIHQFEQAGLIIRNTDEPKRPTNSPKTNYVASDDLLKVLHSIRTENFEFCLNEFIQNHGKLVETYDQRRKKHELTIRVEGEVLNFSPGKHN